MITSRRIATRGSERGFTLIEVLVAATLALGLSLVLLTLLVQAQQMSAAMITRCQLNEEARLVFDMLGTGQAVDGGTTGGANVVSQVIEDTERIEGFREANYGGVGGGALATVLSSAAVAGNVAGSTITISDSASSTLSVANNAYGNTNNRLVLKPTTTNTLLNTTSPRMSSILSTEPIPCRVAGVAPANPNDPLAGGPLIGDPYYDCPNTTSSLTANGYLSYIAIDAKNRPVATGTIDLEYTLVDPRLASWHDEAYTKWDYQETYRTSFLMNVQ